MQCRGYKCVVKHVHSPLEVRNADGKEHWGGDPSDGAGRSCSMWVRGRARRGSNQAGEGRQGGGSGLGGVRITLFPSQVFSPNTEFLKLVPMT